MQFGLLYEMQRPFEGTSVDWNTLYKETLAQCALADAVGFDALWFVEHHFLTGFSGSPCPEVMFGALSQVTKRVRIGFGVLVLPYRNPVLTAKMIATLDQLGEGRTILGVGAGYWPGEFQALGIPQRDTGARTDEYIAAFSPEVQAVLQEIRLSIRTAAPDAQRRSATRCRPFVCTARCSSGLQRSKHISVFIPARLRLQRLTMTCPAIRRRKVRSAFHLIVRCRRAMGGCAGLRTHEQRDAARWECSSPRSLHRAAIAPRYRDHRLPSRR